MKLGHLLGASVAPKDAGREVLGLQNDSRCVHEGDLFFAYPGAAQDGRLFIDKALAAGAVAVAYDPMRLPFDCSLEDFYKTTTPLIAISQLAKQLGAIADNFYDHPSQALQVTGITGTNGKTTIAFQLAQAHAALGRKAAYIGTIGQGDITALQPLVNTTPDALCLLRVLYDYKMLGMHQVCMEVSSHALVQGRVEQVLFNQALFTNLTLDHLDFHHTMDAYGEAKARLFSRPELEYAIINQDSPYAQRMARDLHPHVQKITYGMQATCDVRAGHWDMHVEGTTVQVHSPWGQHQLRLKALGQFNIYNSLAVFTSLAASGHDPKDIVPVMAQLQAAPGRMEVVLHSPYVVVDYAHTPDALKNVLATLHQIKKGRLWVVFGCGGDRDKSKRPVMGKAASEFADHLVLTSDNPRSENPERIVDEIAQGIPAAKEVTKLVNREQAIAYTLDRADKDDIVLIAGKGHEAYQQIGDVKFPFSDQAFVRQYVNK